MATTLKYGLDNRPTYSVAGIRRVLMVAQEAVQDIQLSADGLQVAEISLRAGFKWNMFNELDGFTYNVIPEQSKNGPIYGVEVGFTANIATTAKKNLFESLSQTDLTVIVQDRNNRWWLQGQEQPLTVIQSDLKMDEDTNQYTIKIAGKQRDNAIQMSQQWVQTLDESQFTDMVDAVDGGTLDILVASALNNGGLSGGTGNMYPNHFYTTVTSPPSGYIIKDTIAVILASAGTTIKLPATATEGQQHTVKDRSGSAGSATITVSGNGHLIDGESQFQIMTDWGSTTFIYSQNAWLTTAFVV